MIGKSMLVGHVLQLTVWRFIVQSYAKIGVPNIFH